MKKEYIDNFLSKSIVDETPEAAYISEKAAHRYDDDENNFGH